MRHFGKLNQIYKAIDDYIFGEKFINTVIFAILLTFAAVIRYFALDYSGSDYQNFLSPWYDHIAQNGGWKALADNFANYTPPYLYFLVALTYLPIPKLIAIKLVSIFFDFVLAFTVFVVVNLFVEIKQKSRIFTDNLTSEIKQKMLENNSETYSKSDFTNPKNHFESFNNQNNQINNQIQTRVFAQNYNNQIQSESQKNIQNRDKIETQTQSENLQNLTQKSIEKSENYLQNYENSSLNSNQSAKNSDNSSPSILFQNLEKHLPIIAFFTVLFSPTVIFNGAFWAQCDIIYTTFLILSLLGVFQKKYFVAMVWFAISFSFKLQAVFILPVFIVLLMLRRINFAHFLTIPIIYVLTILPSFLIGRNFVELLRIYADQGGTYNSLTMNSPNFYHWFGGGNFEILAKMGIVIAGISFIGVCYIFYYLGKSILPVIDNLQFLQKPFSITSKTKFPSKIQDKNQIYFTKRFQTNENNLQNQNIQNQSQNLAQTLMANSNSNSAQTFNSKLNSKTSKKSKLANFFNLFIPKNQPKNQSKTSTLAKIPNQTSIQSLDSNLTQNSQKEISQNQIQQIPTQNKLMADLNTNSNSEIETKTLTKPNQIDGKKQNETENKFINTVENAENKRQKQTYFNSTFSQKTTQVITNWNLEVRIVNFWMNLALISSLILPYFLPKMHERYFFVADIISILYAFWCPRRFWIAILINLCSFFSYGPFLLGTKPFDFSYLSMALLVTIIYLLVVNIKENLKKI